MSQQSDKYVPSIYFELTKEEAAQYAAIAYFQEAKVKEIVGDKFSSTYEWDADSGALRIRVTKDN